MAGKAGKDLLLQVEDSAGSGTYTIVGGLRSKSFAMAAEAIDGTSHGSNQLREIVDAAGIKSWTCSGSGIVDTDETTMNRIEDAMRTQTLTSFRIIDNNSGRTYTGNFKITAFELSGEYNAEMAFSISLESSGDMTIT